METTATMHPPTVEDADEAFVRAHLRAVWRYLRMHGAPDADADDLTQDALITALQKGASRLAPSAARAFALRTARFAFLHHVRRTDRALELSDAVDSLWRRDAEADGGDGLLERLQRCLGRLDSRSKDAIRSWYGIGHSGPGAADTPEALAARIGLRPNGLKTLLQRTRVRLRTCLEKHTP